MAESPVHLSTSDKLKEIARNELGETEELKEECLRELRILIKAKNVPCISTDDFLLRFLRTKKFNIQRSFEALRNFTNHRADLHKKLQKLPPGVLEACFRLNIVGILPYQDAQERLIGFVRPGLWNPQICSADELLTVSFILVNYTVENEFSQIVGGVHIIDLRAMPLSHLFYLIPVRNCPRTFLFNCIPARYRRVHVISDSLIYRGFFAVVSPFVPKKVIQRIFFHQAPGEALFEDLPHNILPDDFGGTLGPLNLDSLTDKIVDYVQKLKDEHHYFQQNS